MQKTPMILLAVFCALVLNGCATIFSTREYDIPEESIEANMRVEVSQSGGDTTWGGPIPKSVSWGVKPDETIRTRVKLLDSAGDVIGDVHLDLDWDGWSWDDLRLGEKLQIRVDPITGEMWANKFGYSTLVMTHNGYKRSSLNIRYVDAPVWGRPSQKTLKNWVLLTPEKEENESKSTAP